MSSVRVQQVKESGMTSCPHVCCHAAPGTVHHHARPASSCRFCHYRNAGNPDASSPVSEGLTGRAVERERTEPVSSPAPAHNRGGES